MHSTGRLLEWAREALPAVDHFAHAAGLSGFNMLQDMRIKEFETVTDVKVKTKLSSQWDSPKSWLHNAARYLPQLNGRCMLQVATAAVFERAALPLRSHLAFSSTSAIWSQTGGAHYASANAYLDAHAARSQLVGLPGTAVQFGPFGSAGMAATHTGALEALGLKGLQPPQVCYGGWQGAVKRQSCYSVCPCIVQVLESQYVAGTASRLLYARVDILRFTHIYLAKGQWGFLKSLKFTSSIMSATARSKMSIDTKSFRDVETTVVASRAQRTDAALALQEVVQAVSDAAADSLGMELEGERRIALFPASCGDRPELKRL
jgi:hypothetical protein